MKTWRDEDLVRIVASLGAGGVTVTVTVTQLADHPAVTWQQIYGWRYQLKKKGLWPPSVGVAFLPVDISDLGQAAGGSDRYADSALDG